MSELPTTAAAARPEERLSQALATARASLTLASRATRHADAVLGETRSFLRDLGRTAQQAAPEAGPDVAGGRAYGRYIASQVAGAQAHVAAADAALDVGKQSLSVARQALTELELRPGAEQQSYETGRLRDRLGHFDQIFDDSRQVLADAQGRLTSAQERLTPQPDREWTPHGVEQVRLGADHDLDVARAGLDQARQTIGSGQGNAMSAQRDAASLAKVFQAGTTPAPSPASTGSTTSAEHGASPRPGGARTGPGRPADPRDRT